MANRSDNPIDMTTEELQEEYIITWKRALGWDVQGAQASLLSSEMNRRAVEESTKENRRLADENHNLTIENHKLSKRSTYISFLALFIATISAIFSYIDWKEDNEWQTEQIKEITKISNHLNSTNSLLRNLTKQQTVAEDGKTHKK